jgi:hypothetical protein
VRAPPLVTDALDPPLLELPADELVGLDAPVSLWPELPLVPPAPPLVLPPSLLPHPTVSAAGTSINAKARLMSPFPMRLCLLVI